LPTLSWDSLTQFLLVKMSSADFASNPISRRDYDESNGVRVLLPEHPVFAGTGLGLNDLFGDESELQAVEIDGLPLTDELTVNRKRAPLAPPGVRILTHGYAARIRSLRRVTTMVDFHFEGKGRVLNFGSIGWMRTAYGSGDEIVARISRNAVELLLSEPRVES